METWAERMRRECGEVHAAITAALARGTDAEVLAALEAVAPRPWFAAFTWLWGPALATRDRVRFRPFLLSWFSREALDAAGKPFVAWRGPTAAALEAWLAAADAADDVDLTRRLYGWQLDDAGGKDREARWCARVRERFVAAPTPAARLVALAKHDVGWLALDPATALALYQHDAAAAKAFILAHLPWERTIATWRPVLEAARADATFHADLYRRLVDEKTWRADVLALPAADLDAALERHHPRVWLSEAAEVFHALLEKHGAAAVPYVMRHADVVRPRAAWSGRKEGKGLPEVLALADARGWHDLWATLLRTSATRELFDDEVRRLVKAGTPEALGRLARLPGRGREVNLPGLSFASVHALRDETACLLYARHPALVRGPYRLHVAPAWGEAFPKLTAAALAAGDDDLVDYLASRIAMQGHHDAAIGKAAKALAAVYEALPPAAFVRRAASALGRMPAFAIWRYDDLLRHNPLARLLFERSTALYLADPAAVRDLLESPQIHVQVLGLRILAQRDPRAGAIAAANADLLQATLLRPLHRRTRLVAFAALAAAAEHDEATARRLLGRMREALALPGKRYPTEQLVGLIGRVLHRWPALRGPREGRVVFGLPAGAEARP